MTRLVLIFLLFSGAATAERIIDYHSDITVDVSGNIEVVETVRVLAEGRNIRHGIYRDFPTDYRDRLGNKVRVNFDLLSVQRNGRTEPYHTARLSNGIRIYAGSRDVLVPRGEQVYQFRYQVDRTLGFFREHDELYWNVTGNGWDFTIDQASAIVRLPQTVPASAIEAVAYTGREGERGENYRTGRDDDGDVEFETTRQLPPHHGLTIVVAWPKGHVVEPTMASDVAFLLRHNRGLLIVLGAALMSIVYLFVAWHKVGRDPPPGVIFPHYQPPDGYSPASLRYVSKMGYDKRAFTTAVLNLAVKGYLRIEKFGDYYKLYRTEKAVYNSQLAPGEAVLLKKLFAAANTLLLDNENHARIGAAMTAHRQTLRGYHHRRYFLTNLIFVAPAIALLVATVGVLVILNEFTIAIAIVFVIAAAVVAGFVYLLKAPTLLGRKLLDRVAGFRMYLEVAEKDDLDLRNPPDKTPQLFEAYLPYALALGVEQRWAEQFNDVFRQLREQGNEYFPDWYNGRTSDFSDPVHFADTVGSALNSEIASAATPPGSSSGMGGGGFSGGGGGGGGGGGW